jgi:hypothetical protein
MAFASNGTKLRVGINVIADLTEITGVDLTADNIDVVNFSLDGWRVFMPNGFKDAGEITVSGFFAPENTLGQIALNNHLSNGTITDFSIIFPNGGATWTCKGVVSNVSTAANMDDPVSFSATIKLTNNPLLVTTPSSGLTGLSLSSIGGSLTPNFSAGNKIYNYSNVTEGQVTVTATAPDHTIQMYIDGVFFSNLNSCVPSNTIFFTKQKVI